MNVAGSARFGRIRMLAGRHPLGTSLVFAITAGIAGLGLLLAGRPSSPTGILTVRHTAVLILSLAPLFGVVVGVRCAVGAVRRRVRRRAELRLQPIGPPIEQIAADLRQMLWRHDRFVRSDDVAMSAGRVRALEAAISKRAMQAARALDVSHSEPPAYRALDTRQLRRLLRALRAEGLGLPAGVGLLESDRS
jgi:hypothetical protein